LLRFLALREHRPTVDLPNGCVIVAAGGKFLRLPTL
jgi:hypothetical protein